MAASRIDVLAGVNGAGKSSIAGASIRECGGDYFDPDEAARRIRARNPSATVEQANAAAWAEGKRLLEHAIAGRLNFVFETTLGGTTITSMLEDAIGEGIEVSVWYVGLSDPELHIARVRDRVAHGGHNIPEERIRERYTTSRLNLIRLLPRLTELWVYDNSETVDLQGGSEPRLKLLLHMRGGSIIEACNPAEVPQWAKPILAAAMRVSPEGLRGR